MTALSRTCWSECQAFGGGFYFSRSELWMFPVSSWSLDLGTAFQGRRDGRNSSLSWSQDILSSGMR